MKTTQLGKSSLGVLLGSMLIFSSCMQQMSETVSQPDAGFNGSFEVWKNNQPVNWQLYTSKTAESGNFNIICDSSMAKDGNASVKIDVHICSDKGGRFSPGIAQEIEVKSGEVYHISFWIKNTASLFLVKMNAVSATQSSDGPILRERKDYNDWQLVEYIYTIPEDRDRLRFEVNILQPGEFWIDDVRIEKQDLSIK